MANGGQNVIETVLRSVDEMSKDLTLVTQKMREMQGQAQGTGGGFEKMTQRSVNLQRQLLPLRSAVAQVTTAVATMNPEFSVAIGTVDNLAFAFIRASQGAATTGAAIKAGLLAVFSPLNVIMLAVIATIGFLVKSWLESKKAAEELDKVIEKHGQGIADLNTEYRLLTGQVTEADAALQKLRRGEASLAAQTAQQELARLESIRKALPFEGKFASQTALSILGVSDKQIEEARRRLAQLEAIAKAETGAVTREIETKETQKRTKAEEQLRLAILATQAQTIEGTADTVAVIEEAHAIRLRLIDKEHTKQLEATQNLQLADKARQAAIDAAEQDRKQKIDDFTEKIIASIEKQESAFEKMAAEGDRRLQQLLDNALKAKQAQTDAAVTTAQAELEQARASDATFTRIIELTGNLVRAQQRRIDVEIEAKEAALLSLRAQAEESSEAAAAVEDHIRLLERQLELLKAQRTATAGPVLDIMKDVDKRARDDSLRVGQSIADGILTGLEGGEKGILDFMASLGRNMVRELLTEIFAGLLRGQIRQGILAGGTAGGGGGGILSLFGGGGGLQSILGLFGGGGFGARPEGMFGPLMEGGGFFSDIFGWLGSLFGFFGHGGMVLNPRSVNAFGRGGMVLNPSSVRAFQHGGVVTQGPVMGVVGEEGSELVARMKPGRPGEFADERPIEQRIFFVDQRQKLRPGDVEFIIEDSIHRERGPGKAVKNMIRRTRAG